MSVQNSPTDVAAVAERVPDRREHDVAEQEPDTVAKPSQRCAAARPSIPKTWSSHGLRDIRTSWMSARYVPYSAGELADRGELAAERARAGRGRRGGATSPRMRTPFATRIATMSVAAIDHVRGSGTGRCERVAGRRGDAADRLAGVGITSPGIPGWWARYLRRT